MKKKVLLLMTVVLIHFSTIMAQAPMQRQTPEERTKATLEKLDTLQISKDQKSKLASVFTDLFTAQQKAMEEMRASGSFDRDAMQAKRKELDAESNARVKEILNADQYKKWIDEIQPSLRPQRKAN